MAFNFLIPFLAALIPLAVGFIWYNPKVFGTAWMNASGMTEEKAKSANMALIFIITYILSLFMAFGLVAVVIHQTHLFSIFAGTEGINDPNSETGQLLNSILEKYGNNYRTFKHGVFHGVIAGILIALPVNAINALFERRGFKYIAINSGYWILAMALMGGVICCCV